MDPSTETVQSTTTQTGSGRVFLVVVDKSEEMLVALRFAALRARNVGGRVALLYVIEPVEFQHWMFVGNLMQEEAREEAEHLINELSAKVQQWSGSPPVVYIREGRRDEEVLALLDDAPEISVLVLGASPASEGPGPLVSKLVINMRNGLPVPVTVVPGALDDEQVAALA